MTMSARFMSFLFTFCTGIFISDLCPDSKYETKKADTRVTASA